MGPESILPAAFPALAFAHFLALLSPGQDFFLIAGHAVRRGLPGSRFICLGVALGNAVYIAIAIVGWTGIRDMPTLFRLIEYLGAAYLLYVGFQLLRSKARSGDIPEENLAVNNAWRQLGLGLGSALLNPKNALFYMSLMTVILGREVTLVQQVFSGIWMVVVVLAWDLLVASAIGHQRIRQRLYRKLHLLERGAGAVLAGFGAGLLLQQRV